MERAKAKDTRLLVASGMPPLYRTIPGQSYSHKDDEVLRWISQRPGLLNYVFDKLNSAGFIVYDELTGKWKGVGYED